jgi:hypothetical protein
MDRKTLAGHIAGLTAEQRTAADTIAARVTMATSPAWYGRMRPDHYRRTAGDALAALQAVSSAMSELGDLLAYYRLLWPAEHDDHPTRPATCACRRPADTCPARAAAEAGELTWADETGAEHALADAAPLPEPEPEPAGP